MSPSRRRVLALTGTALTAGCIGTDPTGSGTDADRTETVSEPPTDADSPEPATQRSATESSDCVSGVTVSTDPFAPATQLPASLRAVGQSLVTTAVEAGEADIESYGEAPLRADVIVRHDGSFYRTHHEVVTVETVPAYQMDIYWERGQTAPTDATVVAFDSLPAPDREAFKTATLGPTGNETDGEKGGDGIPQETLSVRKYPAPYPDDGTESRLIGSRTWVRWRDRTFEVEVAGESIGTQKRRTYRYTLEQLADGETAFRQFVARQYVVDLTDLPEAQRSIVSAAIDGGYEECDPQSDALAGLRDRLTEDKSLPNPYEQSWYVSFEGQRYRLQILEWVH